MAFGPKKNGEKMAKKNGDKMGFRVVFLFFRHFWTIFPPFLAEGHFLFFGQFFPIFGFRLAFHSIPGGLTRKSTKRVVRQGSVVYEKCPQIPVISHAPLTLVRPQYSLARKALSATRGLRGG